ncbi:hypothetical protein B0H14DRAFT_1582121 [Mycena olivaceomarginata]|nr:hypothetical protein B0H14DRAFT_1582121 [Mycena olivaceomarginata]
MKGWEPCDDMNWGCAGGEDVSRTRYASRESWLMCGKENTYNLHPGRDQCTDCAHPHPRRLGLALVRLGPTPRPWLQARHSTLAGSLSRRPRTRVPSPSALARLGSGALPPRRRRIELAASSTKAPRRHLLKWCTAPRRRRQVHAMGYACVETDEDKDVFHGIRDHIDIDVERCRGFGGGREDGRRRRHSIS